jgi:hypothetical protein
VQFVVPSTLGPRPATGNSRWPRSRLAACTAEPGLPSTTHRPLHCMWYAYVNKAHAVAAARPTNFRSDRTLFNACMPYATRWPAIRSSICSDRVVCLGTFPSRPLLLYPSLPAPSLFETETRPAVNIGRGPGRHRVCVRETPIVIERPSNGPSLPQSEQTKPIQCPRRRQSPQENSAYYCPRAPYLRPPRVTTRRAPSTHPVCDPVTPSHLAATCCSHALPADLHLLHPHSPRGQETNSTYRA